MLNFKEKYVFKDGNHSLVKEQNVKIDPTNSNSFRFGQENSQSEKYIVDVENKSLIVKNAKELKENLENLNNESLKPLIDYIVNNTNNFNVIQIPVQNIKMDLKLGLTLQMDDSLGLANKLKINATGLQVMPKKSKEYLAIDMLSQKDVFLENVSVPKKIIEYIDNKDITFGNSIGIELFNALINDKKSPVNKINVNYKNYGDYNDKIIAEHRNDDIKNHNIQLMKLGDKVFVPSGASAVAIPIAENNIKLLQDNENKYMIEFMPNVKKGMHGNICLAGLSADQVKETFGFIFKDNQELGETILKKPEKIKENSGYYLFPHSILNNKTLVNVPDVENLFGNTSSKNKDNNQGTPDENGGKKEEVKEDIERENKELKEEIELLKKQIEDLTAKLESGIYEKHQPNNVDGNNKDNNVNGNNINDSTDDNADNNKKEEITPAMQETLNEKDKTIKQLQDENEKLLSKNQELEEKEKAIDSAAKKSYISNGALFFGSLAFLVAAVLTANPILFIAGVVFMGTNAAVPSAFYAQTKRKIEKKYKQLREKRQAKVYEQEQNEQNELSNNIELSKQKLEEAKANKKLVEEKYKDELAAVDKFKEERIQKINEENKKLNEKIENLTKENEKLTNENVKLNEQHKIMNQTLQALPEEVRKPIKDTYESIKQNTKTETITDENVIKEAEAIKQETEKINEQNAEFNEQVVQSEKLANEGIEEMIDADNMNVSGKTDLEEQVDDIKETVDSLEKGNKEITEQLNSKVNLEKNITNNNNDDLTM